MRASVNSDFSEALQTASGIWIQRYSDSALLSKGAGTAGANSVVLPLLVCGVYI